ncbi:V-set domain-containing T-cell activation inhibitor 1-like, partial [Haplochromis burtoni]|uniref:V-set domain-containing T-cell activation inhibitor 1-like n=1 Tax=Haplochromis burtoni TaxID=8153 RepID=UPI0003BD2D7C
MPGSVSLFILLCVCVGAAAAEGQKTITADTGQSTTLSCQAPNSSIIVIEWSRADLGDEYVFLYRDDRSLNDSQHPSFKNRVDLQDRQMKDGNVSLNLKNVTINDTGTYECRVFMEKTRSWISVCNITLSLDPPGQPGGDEEDGEKKGQR